MNSNEKEPAITAKLFHHLTKTLSHLNLPNTEINKELFHKQCGDFLKKKALVEMRIPYNAETVKPATATSSYKLLKTMSYGQSIYIYIYIARAGA